MGNPVNKKLIPPKVNTWVLTFLHQYPGCLKVKTFYFRHQVFMLPLTLILPSMKPNIEA